jgi:hypothetical protein
MRAIAESALAAAWPAKQSAAHNMTNYFSLAPSRRDKMAAHPNRPVPSDWR